MNVLPFLSGVSETVSSKEVCVYDPHLPLFVVVHHTPYHVQHKSLVSSFSEVFGKLLLLLESNCGEREKKEEVKEHNELH